MTSPLINTKDSSMSYSSIQIITGAESQETYAQGFSDSTEIAELKNDLTQIPHTFEIRVFTMRSLMLTLIRVLWKSIKPKVALLLKPGEVRKISDSILVEKTTDGEIILYEVIE